MKTIERFGPGKYELEFVGDKVIALISFPNGRGFSQEITDKKMYFRMIKLFDLEPATKLEGKVFHSLIMNSIYGRA